MNGPSYGLLKVKAQEHTWPFLKKPDSVEQDNHQFNQQSCCQLDSPSVYQVSSQILPLQPSYWIFAPCMAQRTKI